MKHLSFHNIWHNRDLDISSLQLIFSSIYARSWNVMDPRRFDIEWLPCKPDDVHPQIRVTAMKDLS